MERLIVFVLLFLLPTQLAYHFWPQISYIQGLRVDYLAPAVYLTDLLVFLLIPYIKKRFYLLFPFLLLALINTVFAQLPLAALLKWLTIFKLIILGTYFYSCDLNRLKKTIISALSLSLVAFSLIGLVQFILQRTIGGPLYYLGERSFTSQTPGIALTNLFGNSLMRAYSTFPHPNSFAGFVVVSFLILLSLYFPRTKSISKSIFIVSAALVLSLLLTLSLNAIIEVCLVTVLFLLLINFPKGFNKLKVFLPTVLIVFSFLFGAFSLTLPKNIFLKETYKERVTLAGYAIKAFAKRPLLGVGLNNFFTVARSVQPPHNIYLIALSETGIIGTLVLFVLLIKILSKRLNKYLLLSLFFVLFTGFFDHYWFTLQQNELLLSILLGLAVRNYNNK